MMSFAVTQEQRMFSLRLAQSLDIILKFKVLYLHDKNCTFVLPKHLQHNTVKYSKIMNVQIKS